MPDKVVTEVLRIVHTRAHVFKNYDPMGAVLSKETMAKMGLKEDELHPAALKFFKENKVPIGELVEK